MKMEMEMTERDKKLLVFLSIFVIVVCFGYWGIYPNIKAMSKIKSQMQEEQDTKLLNDTKLAQVPLFEKDNETMEQDIVDARREFFPMMSSSEIDKYFTNLVLDYSLYSYDMSISMPSEECKLSPYQFSVKFAEEEEKKKQELLNASVASEEEKSDLDKVDEAAAGDETAYQFDEEIMTGIYMAKITLRLGGAEDKLLKLIDDLSNTDKRLRVQGYSWATVRKVAYGDVSDEDSDYEIVQERVLTITLEIYMCEE